MRNRSIEQYSVATEERGLYGATGSFNASTHRPKTTNKEKYGLHMFGPLLTHTTDFMYIKVSGLLSLTSLSISSN